MGEGAGGAGWTAAAAVEGVCIEESRDERRARSVRATSYTLLEKNRGNNLLYTTDLTATRLRSFAYGLCKSGSGGWQ